MSRSEKIKKTITIALGFALATYLIMSGLAILDNEKQSDANSSKKMKKSK